MFRSGSVSVRCLITYKHRAKNQTSTSYCPAVSSVAAAVAVFFLRPAALSLVCVAVPVPLAGFRKSGNPAPLFRKPLLSPYRFLRPPLGRKTRAGLVSLWAVPCGSLAAALFFSGFPASLCVRPLGEPYSAGSGIALPRKKTVGRPRLVRFFSRLPLTIFIQFVIIYLWLVPTKPTAFAERR